MEKNFWSAEELRALLTVWAADDAQRRINGVCRNEAMMKHIVSELGKLDITRSTIAEAANPTRSRENPQ